MKLYGRWMDSWERRLTLKDRNRQMFPFSWGLDWVFDGVDPSLDPLSRLKNWSTSAIENSEEFFSLPAMPDVEVREDEVAFNTPSPSRYAENNRVRCRIYPGGSKDYAVIVVPQWNADAGSHIGLCKVISRLGLTAVRLTLPYHEGRAPGEMPRADFMVSPNIGRTLHAVRQAVLEVLVLVRWLKQEGYRRVGIIGTSLGSCVSYLAFTHETQLEAGVFNHVSSYFADVVWTGLSTRYVRWGLEGHINADDLRDCWAPLSPWFFVDRLKEGNRPHLMITARYDLTFLPELSDVVFERYKELSLDVERVDLPCGHYTTAHFPYNVMDAWHICSFFRKHLMKPDGGGAT